MEQLAQIAMNAEAKVRPRSHVPLLCYEDPEAPDAVEAMDHQTADCAIRHELLPVVHHSLEALRRGGMCRTEIAHLQCLFQRHIDHSVHWCGQAEQAGSQR